MNDRVISAPRHGNPILASTNERRAGRRREEKQRFRRPLAFRLLGWIDDPAGASHSGSAQRNYDRNQDKAAVNKDPLVANRNIGRRTSSSGGPSRRQYQARRTAVARFRPDGLSLSYDGA